jgi:hypothetical protein
MPDREPLAHWPISRNRKAKKAITVTMKGCNVVTVDTTHRVLQKIQEINGIYSTSSRIGAESSEW